MKLYLSANTDQIYSALTNNSITSFANTIETLQHKTVSFISDNFIFLTKTLLPVSYRQWKTDDIYFPVSLEVDFSGVENIPCYPVVSINGEVRITDSICDLSEAPEDMLGVFICGEIPFAFVSAILFENAENQVRFRKPSPDLWFPEELYKIIDTDDTENVIAIDDIVEMSKNVDALLTDEYKTKVSSTINKRNRYKGLCYFALRETNDWQTDNFKSNVDAYIVDVLDDKKGENGILCTGINRKLIALKEAGYDVPEFTQAKEIDEILLKANSQNSLDKKILEVVIKMYYNFGKDDITISRDIIEEIRKIVLAEFDYGDGEKAFDIIAEFLNSSDMNPQKALDKLSAHPVCKALMKFLDSSDNDGFMKCGCEDLNQYERRYAYMMFGALKGMRYVERELKSNIPLEHRLEELAVKKFPCELLISSVPTYSGENKTYGIEINCLYWMGKSATLAILSNEANSEKVKAVYNLIAKDRAFKVDKLECFEKPCTIILCAGADDVNAIKIELNTVDELKKLIKDNKKVNEYVKKHPMSIQYDNFLKKYIQDDKWYSAVFEKYHKEIQKICR